MIPEQAAFVSFRLSEELYAIRGQVDLQHVDQERRRLEYQLGRVADCLNAVSSDAAKEDMKAAVVAAAPAMLELLHRNADFVERVLVASGAWEAVMSHVSLLTSTAADNPVAFVNQGILRLQEASEPGTVLDVVARHASERSFAKPTFFSPRQASEDLDAARTGLIAAFANVEDHNTDWFGVARGVGEVLGGLAAHAFGVGQVATGIGAISGAWTIAGGTGAIILGAHDIAAALRMK